MIRKWHIGFLDRLVGIAGSSFKGAECMFGKGQCMFEWGWGDVEALQEIVGYCPVPSNSA